jgi:UDPglucose--hexose-1-phosphate uridylyltransferase
VSELRHDALTGRLVLLVPGRATRPYTTTDNASASSGKLASCPFCPGNEHETPPEVARTGPGAPNTPGWRVRVVPNLYPMVGGTDVGVGAGGAHEVIILSPDHDRSFGKLTDDQAVEVVTMLRERAQVHAAAGRAHVQLFVNQGRAAGASIAHPHAQLVALDFVPPAVSIAVERFHAATTDLVLADQIEAIDGDAGVIFGDAVRAWCPRASASPFEVRIAAVGAGAAFIGATDGEVLGLAIVVRDTLRAVAEVMGDAPYNVVLHDAPNEGDPRYHWWVEIVPRTAVIAGFELGTGVLSNATDPVDAARQLRDALTTTR